MSTSLGDLLDSLIDTARRHAGEADNLSVRAVVRADAGTALGHVGRALAQLREDGISRSVGDHRERQVSDLARSCRELAAAAPVTDARMTSLAAAAADTVVVLRRQTSIEQRWAAATAFVDAVGPLCDLIAPNAPAGPITERLANTRRYTLHAEQTAALQPPSRGDATVLDWPIPSTTAAPRVNAATFVRESMAALSFATRSNTETLSVAEVLAVTFAAQSLSEAAQSPRRGTDTQRYSHAEVTTSDAWRAVRTALAPFTDGSRRVHSDVPTVVLASLSLHGALHRVDRSLIAGNGPDNDSIAEAVQHLPAIADDLHRRAATWAAMGGLLAYACDLPPREHHVAQRLAGHQPPGVIRADAVDLRHITDALHHVRTLSTDLAGRSLRPDTTTFPKRTAAAHRAVLEQRLTPAAISEAKQAAYRHLHAMRQHPAPRRGR
jgi:hypothetical protein